MMVYVPSEKKYYPDNAVPKVCSFHHRFRAMIIYLQGTKVEKLSGTEVRRRLQTGEDIPVRSFVTFLLLNQFELAFLLFCCLIICNLLRNGSRSLKWPPSCEPRTRRAASKDSACSSLVRKCF